MALPPGALELICGIQADADSGVEPAVLSVDVQRLAALLLGQSPRQASDPLLQAAVQVQHEGLKLMSYDWVRVSPRVRVTYRTVLETVRLVFCWQALGSPAVSSACELVRSAATFCRETRPVYHLHPFWSELRQGQCAQALCLHLLGDGADGPFDDGPFAVEVFPYSSFEPEKLLVQGHPAAVEQAQWGGGWPEIEDMLVALAMLEP